MEGNHGRSSYLKVNTLRHVWDKKTDKKRGQATYSEGHSPASCPPRPGLLTAAYELLSFCYPDDRSEMSRRNHGAIACPAAE
jgi:hypothetical protein